MKGYPGVAEVTENIGQLRAINRERIDLEFKANKPEISMLHSKDSQKGPIKMMFSNQVEPITELARVLKISQP